MENHRFFVGNFAQVTDADVKRVCTQLEVEFIGCEYVVKATALEAKKIQEELLWLHNIRRHEDAIRKQKDAIKHREENTDLKIFIFNEMKKGNLFKDNHILYELDDKTAVRSLFGCKPTGFENVFDTYRDAGKDIPSNVLQALSQIRNSKVLEVIRNLKN